MNRGSGVNVIPVGNFPFILWPESLIGMAVGLYDDIYTVRIEEIFQSKTKCNSYETQHNASEAE